LAAAAAALRAVSPAAQAQTYPTRPITMNVPYAAGGPLDVMARVIADGLRGVVRQTLVRENIAGAGGSIGTARAARAAPDGYTIRAGTGAPTSRPAPSIRCPSIRSRTSSRFRCFHRSPT